jgi:hypothetical protein
MRAIACWRPGRGLRGSVITVKVGSAMMRGRATVCATRKSTLHYTLRISNKYGIPTRYKFLMKSVTTLKYYYVYSRYASLPRFVCWVIVARQLHFHIYYLLVEYTIIFDIDDIVTRITCSKRGELPVASLDAGVGPTARSFRNRLASIAPAVLIAPRIR